MNTYSSSFFKYWIEIGKKSKLLIYLLKIHCIVLIYSKVFLFKIITNNLIDEDTNSWIVCGFLGHSRIKSNLFKLWPACFAIDDRGEAAFQINFATFIIII